MLVLHETPLGFALFKVLDQEILVKKELSNSQAEEVKENLRKQLKESIFTADAARRRSQRELKEQLREQLPSKLQEVSWENFQEELQNRFSTVDSAREVVQLKAFSQFKNASKALKAAIKIMKNKLSKGLRKILRANCDGETLAVSDSQLGNSTNRKLNIECVHNEAVMELMRGLRSWQNELILGRNLTPMSFCLSYSLSGYKLGISPDKDDPTVIRASNSLRDIEMMLNTYALRVKEWYGWHFPEMDKIVQDNILYAKAVKLMGSRDNAAKLDFSEILSNEVESELKKAAAISIGSEISEVDLMLIKEPCDQVLFLVELRAVEYDYRKSKMNTVAFALPSPEFDSACASASSSFLPLPPSAYSSFRPHPHSFALPSPQFALLFLFLLLFSSSSFSFFFFSL